MWKGPQERAALEDLTFVVWRNALGKPQEMIFHDLPDHAPRICRQRRQQRIVFFAETVAGKLEHLRLMGSETATSPSWQLDELTPVKLNRDMFQPFSVLNASPFE